MRLIEMKRVKWAAGLSMMAQFALVPAFATTITYTGAEQTFTVATTGEYQILAYGAQGGDSTVGAYGTPGGNGAEIGGDFLLTAGEILHLYIGGGGGSANFAGAGGGGTFVVGSGNTPLVVAGGGGGAYEASQGQAGQTTASNSNGGSSSGERAAVAAASRGTAPTATHSQMMPVLVGTDFQL